MCLVGLDHGNGIPRTHPDCPEAKALITFYHLLTGMRIVDVEDGYFPTLAGMVLDLVFQEIDAYRPPT